MLLKSVFCKKNLRPQEGHRKSGFYKRRKNKVKCRRWKKSCMELIDVNFDNIKMSINTFSAVSRFDKNFVSSLKSET